MPFELLQAIDWSAFPRRSSERSLDDYVASLPAAAKDALRDFAPPAPEGPSERACFQGEKGEENRKKVDAEAERAFFEHVFMVWGNRALFPESLSDGNYDLWLEAWPVPRRLLELQDITDLSPSLPRSGASDELKMDDREEEWLQQMIDLDSDSLLPDLERCQSDPDFLQRKIDGIKDCLIPQREALRKDRQRLLSSGSDRDRDSQKKLERLEKGPLGLTLEEELQMLQGAQQGNPESLRQHIAEVQDQIREKNELEDKKIQIGKERRRIEEAIKAEEGGRQEKTRRLAEFMRDIPLLEPMWRQALAELRMDDLLLPGFRIPSFREICEPLFGITQPDHYKRPEGIDYKEVIKTLNAKPEALLSLMKMGLTGGYPDIIECSGRQILFGDCSAKTPLGRMNLNYDESVAMAEQMGLKKKRSSGLMDWDAYHLLGSLSTYHFQDNRAGGFDNCGFGLGWSHSWVETGRHQLERYGMAYAGYFNTSVYIDSYDCRTTLGHGWRGM